VTLTDAVRLTMTDGSSPLPVSSRCGVPARRGPRRQGDSWGEGVPSSGSRRRQCAPRPPGPFPPPLGPATRSSRTRARLSAKTGTPPASYGGE
jgi:hypothetical protein